MTGGWFSIVLPTLPQIIHFIFRCSILNFKPSILGTTILQNLHMYVAMSQNPHTHIYIYIWKYIYIVVLTRPHICKMGVKWE